MNKYFPRSLIHLYIPTVTTVLVRDSINIFDLDNL